MFAVHGASSIPISLPPITLVCEWSDENISIEHIAKKYLITIIFACFLKPGINKIPGFNPIFIKRKNSPYNIKRTL
jgi:hypothetical protein